MHGWGSVRKTKKKNDFQLLATKKTDYQKVILMFGYVNFNFCFYLNFVKMARS